MGEFFDPYKEYERQTKEEQNTACQADGNAGKIGVPERRGSDFERYGEIEDMPILKRKKNPRKSSVGIMIAVLCFVLPLFLIANLFMSNYLHEMQAVEFQREMEEKLNELEDSFYSIVSYNADLVAYFVAEKCMSQVMEIFSISSQTGIAQGTGFIISSDGYVLTNSHVVIYSKVIGNNKREDTASETIYLNFADNDKKYTADCIAFDTDYDLALLKIRNAPELLEVAEFANSADVKYGEPCVAIGNAKSKGLSVTDGVVSNPMINFNFSNDFNTPSIQHSAPINGGNSGGPLYNMFGQVIGINTFKLDTADGTEGMAYAMPSVVVRDWINRLGISDLRISFAIVPEIGVAEE